MRNKHLLSKVLLLVAVMLAELSFGAGILSAAEVTFSPSDFSGQGTSGGGTNSTLTATKDGVTFNCTNGYGYSIGQIRCYSGSTITISSSNIIKSVDFTFSSPNYTGGLSTSYPDLSTNSWSAELSGSAARITSIKVTYEVVVNFTLTATSNNTSYGTVSVDGNQITATPSTGYRVSNDNPYEVTVGSATVSQNDNVFTVTASDDCTVQINFEAIPTYTVTIEEPVGGTLTVKNGEEAVASGSALPVGTELSITATPDDTHKFKNWQAVDASTHTYTATFTYTMTEHNVTLKANFDEIVTYAVNWNVNGTITTDRFEEGSSIVFPSAPADILGHTFVGWVEQAITGSTDTAPTFVSSATMGTSERTFYAVFAICESTGSNTTKTITKDTENFPTSYGTANAFTEYTLEGVKFKIQQVYYNSSKDTDCLQWRASGNSNGTGTMYNTQALNNLQTIVLTYKSKDNSKNFTVNVGTSENPTTGTSITGTTNGLVQTFDCTGGIYSYFVLANGTNAGYLESIAITYKDHADVYSDFRTSFVETVTVTSAGWATYVTKYAVKFTNCNAYIIEDGLAEDDVAYLTKVTNVPAGTPVLVEGVRGQEKNYTIDMLDGSNTDDVSDNALLVVGEYDYIMGNTGAYVLGSKNGNTGFYLWTGDRLAVGKVYLYVPQTTNSRSMIQIVKPGDANSIDVVGGTEITTECFYDLQGRRVALPQRGLYIVNGKKIVLR